MSEDKNIHVDEDFLLHFTTPAQAVKTKLKLKLKWRVCLFLKKVDSIFTLKINISISVRNQLTLLAA